ncbi:FG-GAP repeat domain-containing protein [bacterium]
MKRLEFQIYRILPAALLLVAVFALFSAPAAAVPNFATDTGQDINITRAWSADFVDVDADGDLDYIMGGDTINIEVYRNNGGYNFTQIDDVGDNAYAIAAGDVDGDGDADFAAGHNSFAVNTVWLNDGAGAFTDSTQSIDVNAFDETRDLVLGDVDGDGDLDIAYGNLGEPNYVWLNDGSGIFTDTLQSIDVGTSDLTKSLILSDVDGDGDPDMIYGNLGEPNYVLLNDGTGDFTDSGQAMGTDVTEDVLTADVDGDGDLDILEGVYSVANSLWKNDGAGSFTLTWQSSGYTNDTNSLAAADLDHDGDIDFVAGNNNGLPTVWDNDSTGLFSYVMELEDGCPPLFTNQIHAVDLSGDGAPDVVVTNGGLIGPNCKRTDYIFPNTSTGSNTAPNAQTITAEPDYLTWLNVTDTITLEWNTGSDTETSDPDLLTYDVRLGTSSSGNETFAGDRVLTLGLGQVPSMSAAVPGTVNSVVTVAVSGGGVRLYRTGTGIDVLLGLQLPLDLLVDAAGAYAYVSLSTLDKVSAVNLSTGAKTDIATGSEPRTLIEGPPGTILCMNSGDGTVSVINTGTMTVSSSPQPGTLFSDGVYLSGPGAYFIAEDLWDVGYIQDRTPVVISASIEDAAGNNGSAQTTIYVSVDAP